MTLENQFIDNSKSIQTYLFHKTGRNKELAEDLFQELYIKLRKIANSDKYVEEGKFLNFIKRISSNMIMDHHRATLRNKTYSLDKDEYPNRVFPDGSVLDYILFNANDIEDEPYQDTWVSEEVSEKLNDAIEQLPEAQKELVIQRFYRNMTYKEIVLETGEKQANLLPRMFHAKKNLKKIMNNE